MMKLMVLMMKHHGKTCYVDPCYPEYLKDILFDNVRGTIVIGLCEPWLRKPLGIFSLRDLYIYKSSRKATRTRTAP